MITLCYLKFQFFEGHPLGCPSNTSSTPKHSVSGPNNFLDVYPLRGYISNNTL